ncbi:MAG: UDP-N-acetylmuramate dehydrogenase [Spongiibacteraceae bacterium]
MQISEHIDLTEFNTLALPAKARYFARAETIADIHAAIDWAQQKKLPLLPLGGGSNVVLRDEFNGLVLQIALQGKTLDRHADYVDVHVAAGESWHELVQWTLHQQAYGLENLTLIPGTAGAAPIQNIGAYGVELSQFLHAVRGIKIDDNREVEFTAAQCELGYRDSIFKRALHEQFIVTGIVLRLRNEFVPVIDYPALREQLLGRDQLSEIDAVDALQVERAVRAIRQSKLPDPAQWPNAGSFFKNPVVSVAQFAELQKKYPAIPHFSSSNGVKIPAAWLIDQCGWKGRRLDSVGVHSQQALVLIHYGGGDAAALLALAEQIRRDVHQQFAIELEMEPSIYPR